MKLKSNIAISDNGFLFNPETGDSYTVNMVARDIIRLMQGGISYQEIEPIMLGKYEVSDLMLERDYHDLIRTLEVHNLLETNTTEDE
jgi:hypothetical protein